jgi:hypothetical protein
MLFFVIFVFSKFTSLYRPLVPYFPFSTIDAFFCYFILSGHVFSFNFISSKFYCYELFITSMVWDNAVNTEVTLRVT